MSGTMIADTEMNSSIGPKFLVTPLSTACLVLGFQEASDGAKCGNTHTNKAAVCAGVVAIHTEFHKTSLRFESSTLRRKTVRLEPLRLGYIKDSKNRIADFCLLEIQLRREL